jgi:SAM-dependent methyltransferase
MPETSERHDAAHDSSEYVLGHSAHERRRLDDQGAWTRAQTERLLREAGIVEGMRVLDVGCGTGDVSVIAAGMVGPGGEVVAIDRAADAVAAARERVDREGLRQVHVLEGDATSFTDARGFDAIVGRLVVMHLRDRAGALRHLATLLRDGGVMAFADYILIPFAPPTPARALYRRVFGWVIQGLAGGGSQPDVGLHLPRIFANAGIPLDGYFIEVLPVIDTDRTAFAMLSAVTRTLAPALERMGAVTAAELDIDTLEARLIAESEAEPGTVFGPIMAGAWGRKLG